MIEFLLDYGLFFAKTATILAALLIVIGAMVSAGRKGEGEGSGRLEVKDLNHRFESMQQAIREAVFDDKAMKEYVKEKKKADKKEKKGDAGDKPTVYVIDFDGDMKASALDQFREEITAVLTMATSDDEVVVRLESPGGMVHAYGLAASQLVRFKAAGIPLTICVDKVAASGGYMMACIADKLLSAPFAVLGSIGVVASIPNFNKVLKKNDVDYELLTAGEYKRTLTMFGENTEAGKNKFIEDLEETHELFKGFVNEYRPMLDIAEVATGETWYGQKALEKNLVDAISTSDEYLLKRFAEASLFQVSYVLKQSWQDKLGLAAASAMENAFYRVASKALNTWEAKR